MREYKFRGKTLDGNEWCYGYLVVKPDKQTLIEQCDELRRVSPQYVVDPDTVGMYTGHSDVMGTDMYEGDIVTGYFDEDEWPAVVEWDEVSARFVLRGQNSFIPFDEMGGLEIMLLGNIYDNPDLLYNDKQSEKSEEVE